MDDLKNLGPLTREQVLALKQKALGREWTYNDELRLIAVKLYDEWLAAHPAPRMGVLHYRKLRRLVIEFNKARGRSPTMYVDIGMIGAAFAQDWPNQKLYDEPSRCPYWEHAPCVLPYGHGGEHKYL